MDRLAFGLVLGTGIVAAALFAPEFGPEQMSGVSQGRALAEDAAAEKDAFEAAKELGTVEAWDAFLSNHPTGFYADLARAYVKKLAGEPAAEGSAPPSWCASPGNEAERAICREPDLSRLDDVMNVAYKRAKFDSPKSLDEIDHEQKRWLSRRNLCGEDPTCIRKRYDEQIQFLEGFFGN
jgi:uncharacterized protein YecT (DUF1311 family)